MRNPSFIPVFFHNLEGYDSHLFIRNLRVTDGDIKCIPKSEEKYISFTKEIVVDTIMIENGKDSETPKDITRQLSFVDSFKFMSSSLRKLADNLDKTKFNNVGKYFNGLKLDLLFRKGVYPYDYLDCLEKFNEQQLPHKKNFIQNLIMKEYQMRIINMQKKFGKCLK